MFTNFDEKGFEEKFKGVFLKTLVYGKKTLMTNIKLVKGAKIPKHQHRYEQTGFLVNGKIDFEINGEHRIAEPGDSWTILANIPHGAEAIEDSSIVEVFSPVREDYLPITK